MHLRHVYSIQLHETLLIVLEKAFLTVIIIKIFKNVANVTIIRECSQSSTKWSVSSLTFQAFFLILIVQECFKIEELDNLLCMIFTYRNNQNGGKLIGGL